MKKIILLIVVCIFTMGVSSVAFAGKQETADNFAYVLNTAFDNPDELIENNLTKIGQKNGLTFYRGNYQDVSVIIGLNGNGDLRCADFTVADNTNFKGILPVCVERLGEPQVKNGPSNIASIVYDYEWKSQNAYITLVSEKPSRFGYRDQVALQINPGYFYN